MEPQLEGKRQEMLYKVRYNGSFLAHSLPLSVSSIFVLQTWNKCILAIFDQLMMCVFVFWQYEQLTQMKSAFETRMQRQHELSEVGFQARLILCLHHRLYNVHTESKANYWLVLFTWIWPQVYLAQAARTPYNTLIAASEQQQALIVFVFMCLSNLSTHRNSEPFSYPSVVYSTELHYLAVDFGSSTFAAVVFHAIPIQEILQYNITFN